MTLPGDVVAIVENMVQALSRDILAEAILKLEATGYPVVLHVHDEIVLEVPDAQAQAAFESAINELSAAPIWAPGLPLAAEGKVSDRYGK